MIYFFSRDKNGGINVPWSVLRRGEKSLCNDAVALDHLSYIYIYLGRKKKRERTERCEDNIVDGMSQKKKKKK